MDEKLEQMSKELEQGNTEQFYRSAHAVKSMSANIGAEKVRLISALLESKGRQGEFSEARNSIDLLRNAYIEFVERFEEDFIN